MKPCRTVSGPETDSCKSDIRSVFLARRVAIDALDLPAPHELDPIERRSTVPALDKDRAAETRQKNRRLSAQMATVGCVPVAGVRFSLKILHFTLSDPRNSMSLTVDWRGIPVPTTDVYTERENRASADCPVNRASTAYGSRGAKLSQMIRVTPTPGSALLINAPGGIGGGFPK